VGFNRRKMEDQRRLTVCRDRQRSAGCSEFRKKKSAMAAGADGARRRAKG
jgi:ribosomal protein S21